MKITWSPRARADFMAIASQIADFHSHGASKRWRKGVADAVKTIRQFPRSGRVVPEKQLEYIREALYRDYRIIYQFNSEIHILTILHGKRLLRL